MQFIVYEKLKAKLQENDSMSMGLRFDGLLTCSLELLFRSGIREAPRLYDLLSTWFVKDAHAYPL